MVVVSWRLTASARACSTYPANCLAELESLMLALAEVIPISAKATTMAMMATVIRSCSVVKPDSTVLLFIGWDPPEFL